MTKTNLHILVAATVACSILSAGAFFSSPPNSHIIQSTHNEQKRRNEPISSRLNLIPLSEIWDSSFISNNANKNCDTFSDLVSKIGCESLASNSELTISISSEDASTNNQYTLYLATHVDDLPPITQLTLEVFDATAITLSSTSDWNAFEKAVAGAVFEPAVSMYNSYANAVGYIEVLSGLRRRMSSTVVDGDINMALSPLVLPDGSVVKSIKTNDQSTLEEIAAQSSLILVLATATPVGLNAVASVELRLQPTDAKIPFSQPWLDNAERKIVRFFPFTSRNSDSGNPPLRPYLCNLCVSEKCRGMGIGRTLCRIVESIASQHWGYNHIYLHVDPDNAAARTLYEKEGYKDVGKRWNVMWAGGSDRIGYYVKKLR